MTEPYVDPFATNESRPSVSFAEKPIGTKYTLRIDGLPKEVQARDYDTGNLAFWDDGNIKWTVATDVVDLETGEQKCLWAPKPSAMFTAIRDASKAAGATIQVGGTLTVEYTGDKANPDKPRLNPAKQYAVTYSPPDAFAAPAAVQPAAAAQPAGNGWDQLPAQPAAQTAQPELSPEVLAALQQLNQAPANPA